MNLSKKILLVITLLLIFALSGCNGTPDTGGGEPGNAAGYESLELEEAKSMIDDNPHVILIDVRTQKEYDEKHLPDSVLLPIEGIDEGSVAALNPDVNSIFMVYGDDSKEAAQKFVDLGYSKVFEFGSLEDWPYEVVEGEE